MKNGINPIGTHEESLCEPASWLIKIDFISQFIANNNVLISVLGEKGSGKSTFATKLKERLKPNVQSVLLKATSLFERNFFLDLLCAELQLPMGLSLSEISTKLNERKTLTLCIIDDAEHLPEEFLTELLNALKQQEGNGYFHICLFSDFSLVKMTSRLAREVYKDMIHSVELQPLTEEETNTYVMSCMPHLSEYDADMVEQWLHQFYLLTEGNITTIHAEITRFFHKKPTSVSLWSRTFFPYGAIPLLALTILGIGYILLSDSGVSQSVESDLVQNTIHSSQIALPLLSEIPDYQMAAVRQPIEKAFSPEAEVLSQNEKAVDEASVIEAAPMITQIALLPEMKTSTKKSIPSKLLPHKKPMTMLSSIASSHPSKGQYTIQLLASRDKNHLKQIAKNFAGVSGIKVRSFNRNGSVWYVLTIGEYGQQQQAKNAIKTLPKHLAQYHPWVRQTLNLQVG